MKIKLVDNTEFVVDGLEEYYRSGAQKKYLEINFKGNFSITQLLSIFSSTNTSTIIITDNNGNEAFLIGYNTIFDLRIGYNIEEIFQNKIFIVLTVGEN